MFKNNLIFDVGMHKGEDTHYYLLKGFDVVAFEADPNLVQFSKRRFKKEIDQKRLIIIEGAIVPENFTKKVKFYKNKKNSVWGTVVKDWANRNEKDGAHSISIDINPVNFKEILNKFGVPYYLKIDIEGMDLVCCEALLSFNDKPSYISIESEKVNFESLKKEFNLLDELGYDSYKIIQQDSISKQKEKKPSLEKKFLGYKFLEGSSGLFGNDLPGEWINKEKALKIYEKIFIFYKIFGDKSFLRRSLLTKYFLKAFCKLTKIPLPGWHDTHARHNAANPLKTSNWL